MHKGTYIILCDIAGYISGAPIYYRNKAIFLNSLGWDVRILSSNEGRVYIEGLSRFSSGPFPFMKVDPATLTAKQLNEHLDEFVDALGPFCGERVFVETGTDWTSYWGEALAQRLSARHVVFFLDEDNQRARTRIEFFDYKRRRNEMACITKQTMVNLFQGHVNLDLKSAVGFRACCTNSVQDIEDDFSNSIVRSDFNIGSIGRLDKPLVPVLIEEVASFAIRHSELQIQIVFFGGASSSVEEELLNSFSKFKNVEIKVSGYMWPFAKSALEKMDVFASGAGSRLLSDDLGIPTVAMDVEGKGAIGFVGDAEVTASPLYRSPSNKNNPLASSYFERVLTGEYCKKAPKLDLDKQWTDFCLEYKKQLDYVSCCDSPLNYFDVMKLPLSGKGLMKRILNCTIGESMTRSFLNFSKHMRTGRC